MSHQVRLELKASDDLRDLVKSIVRIAFVILCCNGVGGLTVCFGHDTSGETKPLAKGILQTKTSMASDMECPGKFIRRSPC